MCNVGLLPLVCFIQCICIYFPTGFNPIHLVVRQADGVNALPTNEHLDQESSPEPVLDDTQLASTPDDFIHLFGDSPKSPSALSNEDTDADSLPFEEVDALSKDVGIQCDLVDFLAMLTEYQRNVTDEDTSLFVSAMNMSREDTGTWTLFIKSISKFWNLIGWNPFVLYLETKLNSTQLRSSSARVFHCFILLLFSNFVTSLANRTGPTQSCYDDRPIDWPTDRPKVERDRVKHFVVWCYYHIG